MRLSIHSVLVLLFLLALLAACRPDLQAERTENLSVSSTPIIRFETPQVPVSTDSPTTTSVLTGESDEATELPVEATATPQPMGTLDPTATKPAVTNGETIPAGPTTEEATKEPSAAEATEFDEGNFTLVDFLNNISSEFPFFDGSREEQVLIPPEELLIDVRRVDETWKDPLAGRPFEFNDEMKGITTIRGFTAEDLRRYTLGTIRLNLIDHGYTDFASSSPEEFIQNYEKAKAEDTQVPPITIHGIDYETGEYTVAEISLNKFMIYHYIEIGNVNSLITGKLNFFTFPDESMEYPLFWRTGSTGTEIAHSFIIDNRDSENPIVIFISRIHPINASRMTGASLSQTMLRPFQFLALSDDINEYVHTIHEDIPKINGSNIGEFYPDRIDDNDPVTTLRRQSLVDEEEYFGLGFARVGE